MHRFLPLLLVGCARVPATAPGVPPELAPLDPPTAEAARLQIWLSRTPYQPGVIDGHAGTNTRRALAAFQHAQGLPPSGDADARTLTALARAADAEQRPLTRTYTVTADDVDGPFIQIPEGLYEAHALPCMCYRSPWEELAERFEVSPGLLAKLNPKLHLDTLHAGDRLVVPDPTPPPLTTPVASIRIDVDALTLTALDVEGRLLRQYPTVVGPDFAAYRGTLTVTGVARDPDYRMDPDTWKELPRDWPAVTIPPGPNNPVGVVWMQLSKAGYGIHGTPSPVTIGHTESHGCVRLTNWSALELSQAVRPGQTRVDFVGMEKEERTGEISPPSGGSPS